MAQNTLLQLKENTGAHHQALENAIPLASVSFTEEQYVALLQAFYGFFSPWEDLARLFSHDSFRVFLEDRTRAHLLVEDLKFFASTPPTTVMAVTGRLDLSTDEKLLGSMYVLEGSRLGGQVLAAKIEKELKLNSLDGVRFFRGFGSQTLPRWREFCSVIEEKATGQDKVDEMIHAAQETFSAIHNWLTPQAEKIFGKRTL